MFKRYIVDGGVVKPVLPLTKIDQMKMREGKDFIPAILAKDEIVIPLKYADRVGKVMEELGIYNRTTGKFK